MRRQHKEQIVVKLKAVQRANELSEISKQIAVKQQELEKLRSEIAAVRADVQNLESLKKTAFAEVEEEKNEMLDIARDEANEFIKETTALKASALAEIEELKKVAREFQRIDDCLRSLGDARVARDSLDASLKKILADLVLIAPLLAGSKTFFPSTVDLRGQGRERLLNLAKQEGWKGE